MHLDVGEHVKGVCIVSLRGLPRLMSIIAMPLLFLAFPAGAQSPDPAPQIRFTDIPFEGDFVVTLPADWFFWRRADFGSPEEADNQVVGMINSVNLGVALNRPFISDWDRLIAIPSTPIENGLVRLKIEMENRDNFAARAGVEATALSPAGIMQIVGGELAQTLDVNGRYTGFGSLGSAAQATYLAVYLFDDRVAILSMVAPDNWTTDNRELIALLLMSLRRAGEPLDTFVYRQLTDEPLPERFELPTETTAGIAPEATAEATALAGGALAAVCLNGRSEIAFVSDRDGDYEIYLANSDGGNVRRLTASPGIDVVTAWSPDGDTLYFHSVRNGGIDIFAMSADGGDPIALSAAAEDDMAVSVSPSGSQIAFHRIESDGTSNIYIANADGSNPQRLGNFPGSEQWPNWSPDGTQLAFNADVAGMLDIYVINIDGTGLRRLTSDPASDGPPLWSPDGREILFWAERDGEPAEVYVMNADGGNSRQLTYNDTADFVTSWSPDGRFIAVEVGHDGNSAIAILDADGRNARPLTDSNGVDMEARWRPCAPASAAGG